MLIKGIKDECLNDYKKAAMYVAFPKCTFKCDFVNHCQVCQNMELSKAPDIEYAAEKIAERYINNPLTEAMVFSGLDPMDTPDEMIELIDTLRNKYNCNDDIVIYTGYNKDEVAAQIEALKAYSNIIVKFGRFIFNDKSRYDEVLGITLASENQYAEKIS